MGKRAAKVKDYLLLLILAITPFGQLPGLFVQSLLNLSFRLHPLDILVFFTVIFTPVVSKIREISGFLRPMFTIMIFGMVLSVFTGYFDLQGALYSTRIVFYSLFFVAFLLFPTKNKTFLIQALIIVGVNFAIFGWVQYFLIPDLTSLKLFGWDDHYFRLTSTFLDPAFTGILLVFSSLTTVFYYLLTRKRSVIAILVFLLLTLAYTYSRASFLALFVGLFVLLWKRQKKLLFLISFLLISFVMLLPQNLGGEGVNLSRVNSINQKFENYAEGFRLVSNSPVFGLGYNNICKVKTQQGLDISAQKNSCYGLDNSFLVILASAGILGLFIAFDFFGKLRRATSADKYGDLFKATVAATFVHSLFTNTLFYPWVIVWLAILASMSRSVRRVKESS